ncbi:MAG: translesion DNA synthesis-associated protein ImuA [Gammaproteobacteria bacterium]|nr:translesion DNA synthesis-associated protein ImuA [Gammaproteobacteria bacterium]MBV9621133.1 translesion DNA synthesis-associated protein ImuA [Gammaproteobacteria bacterium]
MDGDANIARLLEHPAIWRGRSAAPQACWPSGFTALDARLPAGGWPRSGLIEVLARFGSGELTILLPLLAQLTQRASGRWCVWVAPPLLPFAPGLSAQGVRLERIALVSGEQPLWSFEQVLRSGACDAALAWIAHLRPRDTRRLQLAATHGRTLGVLFRARGAAREPSAAQLRLAVSPAALGVRVTILKGRSATGSSLQLTPPLCEGSS